MSGKSNLEVQGSMSATQGAGSESGSASLKSKNSYDDTDVDLVSSDEKSAEPAGTTTYTFDDASMVNQIGGTADFDALKAVMVYNTDTTENIDIGGALLGAGTVTLPPGAALALDFGSAGVSAAGQTLTVTGAGPHSFQFIANGISA